MKKRFSIFKGIFAVLAAAVMLGANVLTCFASSTDDIQESRIIGCSTDSSSNRARMSAKISLPNILTVDWKASSTQIFIYVKNIGIDSVDSFTGTVKVTGGSSKSFSAYKLKPGSTRTITVNLNMTKCYEDINVTYVGRDGKTDIASNVSHGHREVPSYLKSVWNRGTFPTVEKSIEYHFRTHHSNYGVNAADIQTYLQKAYAYRNSVVRDKNSMSAAALRNKYAISKGTGSIPSTKYKHRANYQFVIISNAGSYILSYGGR